MKVNGDFMQNTRNQQKLQQSQWKINGKQWNYLNATEKQWKLMAIDEDQCTAMDNQWESMQNQWKSKQSM